MDFKKYFSKKWSVTIIILLSIIVISIIGVLIVGRIYHDRIYPGVHVGSFDLTGKSLDEAEYYIQQEAETLKDGLVFYYQDKEVVIGPTVKSFDIDLSYEIFSVNPHQTALNAYAVGRDFNFLINFKDGLLGLFFNRQVNLAVEINEEKVRSLLEDNFQEFTKPMENATLVKDQYNNFVVKAEQAGVTMNYDEAIKTFGKQLIKINKTPIGLKTVIIEPEIFKQDALNIDSQAKQILALAPLTWQHQDKDWEVTGDQMSQWLDLRLINDKKKKQVVVGLNQTAVQEYLAEVVAPELDQPAVEAKFKMSANKVNLFQAGQDGWEMNLEASAKKIVEAVQQHQSEVALVVEETKAISNLAEPEELGIKEIVGTGTSDFAGSPANRRHNIKIGADTLNGLLIKPGEEFSLIKALGAIDGSAGYLTELVIRDNKTTPEYGGGLCQIGTTMFRTALAAGLPITMRRNHSYRVGYYEPAGTDATIYDPLPDLRFINDFDHYILIQTRIEGNTVTFDFWGTKDGREVAQTKPAIYNIVEPAPTKIVETLDLKPGEKKCTERAHNGADAYFTRTITTADGKVKEETFSSHYVPWQEVCLLGVGELTETPVDTTDPVSSETPTTGVGVYESQKQTLDNNSN